MNAGFASEIDESGAEEVLLDLLSNEGWGVASGAEIDNGGERNTPDQVVLLDRLHNSIRRINPGLSLRDVDAVVDLITRADSQAVRAENWRAYSLLVNGATVETRDEAGDSRSIRANLVDWTTPSNNDFIAVHQLRVSGLRDRRPDVVLFVNGLPMVVVEMKRPGDNRSTLRSAFNQVQNYVNQIPDLFTWNQLVVLSDGLQARAGTFDSRWEHLFPWRVPDSEGSELRLMVTSLLTPAVLTDVIRNFVVFYRDEKRPKVVAKYHQYAAVRKALASTVRAVSGDRRAGVIWHSQGSGKSLEMLWLAATILRSPELQNPTVVVVTDRNDLDDQLLDEVFAASRTNAPLPELPVQAESRAHLADLLEGRQSGGVVFTTIQKFSLKNDDVAGYSQFPMLSGRNNIVVIVDEAHRSNYDFIDGFARNIRDAFPHATFIGFTGTPIESADRSTTQVFGPVIDSYDLTQAIVDGATVKIYYEARLARVAMPLGGEQVDSAFDFATVNEDDELATRLKMRASGIEAIMGSDERLHELAQDIVEHWEQRREALNGKGMIVAFSRRIAVRLYDEIVALRPEWSGDESTGKLKVVITGSAADESALQPHIRSPQALRSVKARAKDPADELELVIVRDMWLTGFDSPPMHTMYVDKPMRGANLMQAIARINRTFGDKPSALIVDYFGIADDLRQALAEYTDRDRETLQYGEDVHTALIPVLRDKVDLIGAILFSLPWREWVRASTAAEYIDGLGATVDYLIAEHSEPDCTIEQPCRKHRFLVHTSELVRTFASAMPSPEAMAFREEVAFFDAVRAQLGKVEGSDREGSGSPESEAALRQIVSEAIAGLGVIDLLGEAGLDRPDLSILDERFIEKFRSARHPSLQLEVVRRLLEREVNAYSRLNITAGSRFSERLAETIARYEDRAVDAAQTIVELVGLAELLRGEPERGWGAGLNDRELALYDAIGANDQRPEGMDEEGLKDLVRLIAATIEREALGDWVHKEQLRAKLRASVRRVLLRSGFAPSAQAPIVESVILQAEAIARSGA